MDTDERRAADARSDAIAQLYVSEGVRLYRAVYAYAGNRDIAADAVAEGFAQLLARGSAVRQPERWIWTAAFRIAAGELQRRRRQTVLEEGGYEMEMPDVGLVSALRSLTDRQRAVVVLHYYVGYSSREIGARLGSSPVTVRVQLTQARRRLRTLLGGPDDRDA